jgi:hypothetical protein
MSSSLAAGVNRLEIKSVMLVFRPSFVNCWPLTFSLVQHSPPPLLPCVKSILDTLIQCVGGGGGVVMRFLASDTYTLAAKSLYR